MTALDSAQMILGGFILAGIILTVIAALIMRRNEFDSAITIFFLSLVGAAPIWIYTVQAASDDLLLVLGILGGVAYMVALQGLSSLVLYSEDWHEVFWKSLSAIVLAVFLGGTIFFLVLQTDLLDAIIQFLDNLSHT